MKKILNYASLFVIALVCCFSLVMDVNAACDENSEYECRETSSGDIYATGNRHINGISTTIKRTSTDLIPSTPILTIQIGSNGESWEGIEKYLKHYENGGDGTVLFCMDPADSSVYDLYARRFLLMEDSDKNDYAYDIAVMSILTNASSYVQTVINETGVTGDDERIQYLATSIAIRALTALWGYDHSSDSNTFLVYRGQSYRWAIADWAGYKDDYEIIKQHLSVVNTRAKMLPSYEKYYMMDTLSEKQPIMLAARRLFGKALSEAADYLESSDELASAEPSAVTEVVDSKEESNVYGEFVSRDVKHTLILKNFSNDGKASFVLKDLKYDYGASALGASSEPKVVSVTVNGEVISGTDFTNRNLLEGISIDKESIQIDIVIHFEGYTKVNDEYKGSVPKLVCEPEEFDYTLNYVFNDSSLTGGWANKYKNYVGVIWDGYYSNGALTSGTQRFISLETIAKGSEEEPGEEFEGLDGDLTGKISLNNNCEEELVCEGALDACKLTNNINSEECQDFLKLDCGECKLLEFKCEFGDEEACDTFVETCEITCETVFTTFECCDEEGMLIVSELDDHEVSIKGPEDVKTCFVTMIDKQCDGGEDGDNNCANVAGAKDQKGNSYSLSNSKNKVEDNKYCTVSCKEDYIMTMPTAKLVNAGRYFTFKAKVDATKACYTNTIDKEQFAKDLYEAEDAVREAYNEYARAKAHLDGLGSKDELEPINHYTYIEVKNGSSNRRNGRCSNIYNGPKRYEFDTVSYKIYTDINGNPQTMPSKIAHYGVLSIALDKYERVELGQCQWKASDEYEIYNVTYKNPLNSGKSYELTDGDVFKEIVEYTESVLNKALEHLDKVIEDYNLCSMWESEINYDPEVYYDYEETYLNDFGLIGEMEDNLEGKKIEDVVENTKWYCNGDINSEYTECEGIATEEIRYFASNEKFYTYKNIGMDANVLTCNVSGCYLKYRDISSASYVKTESKVDISYKPKTLFYNIYPSGEITINKEDDNVALENKLPVALDTERGIYKYTVNIENLGEFYDKEPTDNLGRYVGSEAKKSSKAVVDPEKLIYACSYLVNITETEGWICDFDDECTDDCISNCIGPNCDGSCEDGNCIADCIGLGCIYDSEAGSSLLEKVVSLNNLFPNGTDSYNWDKDENTKANTTVTAIEEKGNVVYDEEPILSITLDATAAKQIKSYNDSVESEGGYSNSTVYCEAAGDYEEIICYSEFIDDILSGGYGNIVNDKSKIAVSTYRESYGTGESADNYFSLWDGEVSEKDMIGPAWK